MLLLFITGCGNSNDVKSNDVKPEDTIFFKDNNQDINITNKDELNKLTTNSFIAKVNENGSYTIVSENNLNDGDEIVVITILDGNYLIDEYVFEEKDDSNLVNNVVLIFIIIFVFIIIIEIVVLFRQNIYLRKLLIK